MRKDRTGKRPFVDYYPGFLHLMGDHGWTWFTKDHENDYNRYRKTLLGRDYHVTIQAIAYDYPDHLCNDGHFGVAWLECVGYPDCTIDEANGVSISELKDMVCGMEKAERDLVLCGIPFTPDYKFHGPDAYNLKRRNDATRKRLNLEHWEEVEDKDP